VSSENALDRILNQRATVRERVRFKSGRRHSTFSCVGFLRTPLACCGNHSLRKLGEKLPDDPSGRVRYNRDSRYLPTV